MFLARRLNSGIPYQISASGVNMAMSMTLGLITYSNALSATATGLCRTEAETTELKPKRAEAMLDEKRMFVATKKKGSRKQGKQNLREEEVFYKAADQQDFKYLEP